MTRVYLDNNATTRVDPAVVEAMLPYLTEHYGNPSSMHAFGGETARAIRTAREAVRALIGAGHSDEIIFTSGGTEANTTAIRAGLAADPARTEIVTSAVEHPAILALCGWLERHEGVTVHRVPVDRAGQLEIDAYRAALGPKTALVSLMWANNETGTVFPVEGLADLAKEAGALFHTDAVQATGKVGIAIRETAVDLLSLSGHKIHGPKGVGALYLRRGTRFRPLIRGGHQERGRRAGTENAAGIVGLGKAADLAGARLGDDTPRIRALRDRLETGLCAHIPFCHTTGDPHDRLPNTTSLAFENVDGEAILLLLDQDGIAVSSGSACSSGSLEPSHVMRAIGLPPGALHGVVRFSLSRETTEDEIDRVLELMPGIVGGLRQLSPFGPGAAPSELAPPPARGAILEEVGP